MFQVIARNATQVTVIFLADTDDYPKGRIVTWSQAEYRIIGCTVTEFVPTMDTTTVPFIDGNHVPVVPARKAKCHDFAGGWNGYSFYADSKGALYAVASK